VIEIIKGGVNPANPAAIHQVDALSGATLTSRGVNRLLLFWLGEHGFGPYLAKLRQQGV
jgi:Na+-transporting NADH:ubiquinone oxidoreductase subunit C